MDTSMDQQEEFINDVPRFDVKYYFGWRSKMKAYLKKFGVWEIFINQQEGQSNSSERCKEEQYNSSEISRGWTS